MAAAPAGAALGRLGGAWSPPAFHVQLATACHFLILTSKAMAAARSLWQRCGRLGCAV